MALAFPANPTTGQRYQNWVFDGVKWVVQAGTLAEAPNTPVGYARDGASGVWVPESPNPNKLINPFNEIDQAREGVSGPLGGATYIADGRIAGISSSGGGAASGVRIALAAGSPNGAGTLNHITMTVGTAASSVGASDYLQFASPIEASDLADTNFGQANAKNLTVSFWAWCTAAGTYYFSLRNGPSPSTRSYVAPFTIAAASVWQFIVITMPGDTGGTWQIAGNGLGMLAAWTFAAGTTFQASVANSWQTGNAFGLTGQNNTMLTTAGASAALGPIQLEVGTKATPMLRQSFQQELARCQRYYEKSYSVGTAIGSTSALGNNNTIISGASVVQLSAPIIFKVVKRVNPTAQIYSFSTGAAGYFTNAVSSTDVAGASLSLGQTGGVMVTPNLTSGNQNIVFHWAADARL